MNRKYRERVELHCHSVYSKHEGVTRPEEILKYAKSLGMPAVGMTDFNEILAFPEMDVFGNRDDYARPIYGMEALVEDDNLPCYKRDEKHEIEKVTILVKNQTGLKNLYRMIGKAESIKGNEERKILMSQLMELHEGLLYGTQCTSCCMLAFPQIIKRYDFIEFEPPTDESKNVIKALVNMADEYSIPVVAISNACYLRPEESLPWKILREFDGDTFDREDRHFRTTGEMLEEFSFLGEEKAYEVVVENTNKIAEMCQLDKIMNEKKAYPKTTPEDEQQLKELCLAAISERYDKSKQEKAQEIFEWEFQAIHNTQMAFYFLMLRDILHQNNLRACDIGNRGVGAGSIVAYLLDISGVDPIHYNLRPEFIYGLKQKKEIDLDLSIPEDKRNEVMHAAEKWRGGSGLYGGTVASMGNRTAEAAVLLYEDKHPEFKYCEGIENHGEIVDRFNYTYRGVGYHSGGTILIPKDVDLLDYTPYSYLIDYDRIPTLVKKTYFDYHSLDNRLLKLDLLASKELSVLQKISQSTGIDLRTIPFFDDKVLELFCGDEVDCADIPEFGGGHFSYPEKDFIQAALAKFAPKDFDDLVKFIGLMHGTNVWTDNGEKLIEDGLAPAKDLMGNREDIFDYLISLRIERETAYSITESVRKGKVHSGKCSQWPEWKNLILKAGAPDWYIWSCEQIQYMFPRAHVVAIMQEAWRFGWFKVYYPEEYKMYSHNDNGGCVYA